VPDVNKKMHIPFTVDPEEVWIQAAAYCAFFCKAVDEIH